MSTHPLTTTQDAPPEPAPPSRRATGAAGLATLVTYAAAVLVAPKQDLTTRAQLHAFLEDNGRWQAVAWLLMVLTGLAWLVLVVGLRRLLPGSPDRDLFTAAAVAGQAATWAGASLNTAAAPPAAHSLSLPVYQAFGEAGHLAVATGTAATGLALLGLARAAATSGLWSSAVSRGTTTAGVLLIVAAVVGPVSVPVYALWLLIISILLLASSRTSRNATAG
jgi:hypothetical protein